MLSNRGSGLRLLVHTVKQFHVSWEVSVFFWGEGRQLINCSHLKEDSFVFVISCTKFQNLRLLYLDIQDS